MQTIFNTKIPLPFDLPTSFYGAMLLVWMINPGLQRRYPLHLKKQKDYLGYLAWCATAGRNEYKILTEIDEWNIELTRPAKIRISGIWSNCINQHMYLIGLARAYGNPWLIKISEVFRHSLVRSYFREAVQNGNQGFLPEWQIEALRQQFHTPDQFLSALIFQNEETKENSILNDLACQVFSVSSENTENAKALTFSAFSRATAKILRKDAKLNEMAKRYFRRYSKALKPTAQDFERLTASLYVEKPAPLLDTPDSIKLGVNLFGYAKGELGIGEDVRTIALSLQAAKIPFCVINIELADNVSQADETISQWLVSEPMYDINIFCMTAIEHTRFIAQNGLEWVQGRYNIGVWPWELPKWPCSWQHVYEMVQEVWGISEFASQAYLDSEKNVLTMPLPVIVENVGKAKRSDWNLPEKPYLFIFSFDMNSTVNRKNPKGLLKAFDKAFSDLSSDQVGLVLKVNHPDRSKWKVLLSEIEQNDKVHLIQGSYRKAEVLGLYQSCDCFVSLHRSEGFGRSIAEAQILGLDTIATGFSGNVDFCQMPTKSVDYQIVDLQEGEYFLSGGQYWAEPNIEHAAKLMRESYQQKTGSLIDYQLERFSTESCGIRYRKRLEEIVKECAQHNTSQNRETVYH